MEFGGLCSMVDPPILYNHESFPIWKKRMIAFLNFTDSNFLESIKNGPHIPPMEKSKWTDEDKKKVRLDHKAKYTLTRSLSDNIFYFVLGSKSAKETWDKLILHVEGTDDTTRDYREIDLMNEYVGFKYKYGESVTDTYIRFNCLINELKKEHDMIFDNSGLVFRFLTSVPPALKHVSMLIQHSINFKTTSLQSLYGTLLAHELKINTII